MRIYVDGKVKSKTFRADGRRAAERKAPRVEADMWDAVEAVEAARGTVGELVDDWLDVCARSHSPTTMREYRMHAGRFVERFGPRIAAELTGRDIDRWYSDMLAEGRSAATVSHTHRIVRAVLRWGYRYRDLPNVATDRAAPPKHRAPEISVPSGDLMRVLLGGLRGEWGRAIGLSASTGLRRGEVVGLQWADVSDSSIVVRYSIVDLAGGGVHVGPTKGKRVRRVEIGPWAAGILTEQRAAMVARGRGLHETPWVFANWGADDTGATPRRPGWMSTAWGRHRKRHGAESVRLHTLRHWYATTALDAGVPLHSVSEQLGHAQASTTSNIYGHGTAGGRSMVVDAVERALREP